MVWRCELQVLLDVAKTAPGVFIAHLKPLATHIQALWVRTHMTGGCQLAAAAGITRHHIARAAAPQTTTTLDTRVLCLGALQDQGLLRQGERVVLTEGLMIAAAETGERAISQARTAAAAHAYLRVPCVSVRGITALSALDVPTAWPPVVLGQRSSRRPAHVPL